METKGPNAEGVHNDLYEAAARRFEALFDGIPIACLTFDEHGLVFEWNKAAIALWEKGADEAFQTPLASLLHPPEGDNFLDETIRRVFSGENVVGLEWEANFSPSLSKWVVANAFPVRSPEGRITGGVMACMDMTARLQLQQQVESQLLEISQARILLEFQRDQLSEANRRLEELATTDGLTGLKNHRAFQEFLQHQFEIAKRSREPLSLLLLDVDHFKNLNDEHGHPTGDSVLAQLGQVLERLGRKSDFIARYGGEEFAIVLPNTDTVGALEAGERFRSAIEAEQFKVPGVTASFGCATLNLQDGTHRDIITRADMALYGSKRGGRNQVTHWNGLSNAA